MESYNDPAIQARYVELKRVAMADLVARKSKGFKRAFMDARRFVGETAEC
jgi:hypothetical protein